MFGQGQGAASLVAVVIDNYSTVVVAHKTVAGLRRQTQRTTHDDTNSSGKSKFV